MHSAHFGMEAIEPLTSDSETELCFGIPETSVSGSRRKPTIVAEESISSPVCLWDVFGKRDLVSARLNIRVASLAASDGTISYSYRSATTGSTLVARRAGKNPASIATPIRTATEYARISGSAPAIPNRSVFA